MTKTYIGGSFAPPLSDELLASYRALIDAVSPKTPLREALEVCYACCTKWWELPASTGTAKTDHPAGKGIIVELEKGHQEALWDHIPWDHELKAMGVMFGQIDNSTQKPLRDCAYHMLWHAKELELDREPLTSDQL